MLLIRFAVPAAIAAAGILTLFADLPAWATWHLADVEHQITPVKAVIGTVIIASPLWSSVRHLRGWRCRRATSS